MNIYLLRLVAATVLIGCTIPSADGQSRSSIQRPRAMDQQLQRARTAFVTGSSLLEAKARVDRVLNELPADAEARVLRAEILLRMERFDEALVDAREATRLAPSNGEAHLVVADAALRNGDARMAELAMDRAARLVVDNAAAHVRLSRIARALDLDERSVAFARIAVALEGQSAAARYELARAFVFSGNLPAARSIVTAGLEEGLLSRDVVAGDSLLVQTMR